jgi:hypothetical protein
MAASGNRRLRGAGRIPAGRLVALQRLADIELPALIRSRDEWAVERYSESLELDHLNVVRRWPELFKSHTTDFNDLIVSNIRALLRRR